MRPKPESWSLPDNTFFGFLNIDKPLEMTSHTVVARVRRHLGIKKVGHAGTLDPLATGVLVVCVGPATRLSEFAMASTKSYRARVRLGTATTTDDAEGEVISEHDVSGVEVDAVTAVLPRFTGEIAQLPPIYSAIKKDGRKLYERARAGEIVEREARQVTIHEIALIDWQSPDLILDVVCGAGTYIRSLARDLGEALGISAHLAGLVRTSSGRFSIEQSVQLETLLRKERDDIGSLVAPPDVVLQDLIRVDLTESDFDHVSHGRPVNDAAPVESEGDMLARAYNQSGELVAILRASNGRWRPHRVFANT